MNTGRTNQTYILWGGALSLYSGKARSFLIKKRIPYREFLPSHEFFQTRLVPALGFLVVPVLEAPDGTVVQDTSDIIAHLNEKFPEPSFVPATPVQQVVASLIGAFGSEFLLKAAMHYRWSFLEQQRNFLVAEFGRCVSASHDPVARAAAVEPFMAAMQTHLPRLGIYDESIPAIEHSYEELLDILEAHFQVHPYVLGGRPSDADFGLMAPLFAHLGRDPYPAALMKNRAPNVFRWTERMNLADLFDGEFPEGEPVYPSDDAIPATLEPLLKLIFADWGAELLANADKYDAWIAANPSLQPGDLVSVPPVRQLHPTLGEITFDLRGKKVHAASAPQTLWHFERVLRKARLLSGAARGRLDALLHRTGGEAVMAISLARPLARKEYVLVLA